MYATSERAAREATELAGTTAVIASSESNVVPLEPPLEEMAPSCAALGRPLVWMMTRTCSPEAAALSNSGANLALRLGADSFFLGAGAAPNASGERYVAVRPRAIKLEVILRNMMSLLSSAPDACPRHEGKGR